MWWNLIILREKISFNFIFLYVQRNLKIRFLLYHIDSTHSFLFLHLIIIFWWFFFLLCGYSWLWSSSCRLIWFVLFFLLVDWFGSSSLFSSMLTWRYLLCRDVVELRLWSSSFFFSSFVMVVMSVWKIVLHLVWKCPSRSS